MRPAARMITAALVAALAGSARARVDPAFPASIELSGLNTSTGFTRRGVAALDQSGFSVASAGDINGDGVGDLVIGAFGADPGGRQSAGSTYVVFGVGPGGAFPATFELSSLNGANGFRLDGEADLDFSGFSVAGAVDVNADGVDDLLIGAEDADPVGRLNAGATYVVFGRHTRAGAPFPASIALAELDGDTGFRLNGAFMNDRSGICVARAGDINGDGVDDVVIGASLANAGGIDAGAAYVVFGRDTGVGAPFPPAIELSALNGQDGFRLTGAAPYDYAGRSVAGAGDVNGDGIDDLVVGAYLADLPGRTDAGITYVLFGKNTSASGPFPGAMSLANLTGASGFRLLGAGATDRSGLSVAGVGDMNGDGLNDLLIGAYQADPGGREDAGASYVVFGRHAGLPFSASVELAGLNGADGFRLDGVANFDRSGRFIAGAGDINDDGVDDILIGAAFADPGGRSRAGSTYVVFGKDTSTVGQFPAALQLAGLSGADGFRLDGAAPDDYSGICVASAGDINSDGADDLVIGAFRADPAGRDRAGASYVVFGQSTSLPPCPGDANGDRIVNFTDLNIVLSEFGQTGPALQGDLNNDHVVNFLDLNIVLSFFGAAC